MESQMASLNQNREQSWETQLITAGLLTDAQMDLARREHQRGGAPLGDVLVQLGFVPPAALATFIAKEAEARVVSLDQAAPDRAVLDLVPSGIGPALPAASHVAGQRPADGRDGGPVRRAGGGHAATGDGPGHRGDCCAGDRDPQCAGHLLRAGETIKESIDRIWEEKTDERAQPLEELLSRMAVTDNDAPVINLVRQIIMRAVNRKASDLHFEPEERMMRVRARIDGVLYQDELIPKSMQSAVGTRVKILWRTMDLTESHVPQDGRASIIVGGRQVNLRCVSSLPTAHGENIVVRILDPSGHADHAALAGTGTGHGAHVSGNLWTGPYGVVLVTGPTGSGKSLRRFTRF